MHISSFYMSTTKPERLISGICEINHEGTTVKLELSEKDRTDIQQIIVNAFLAERHKMAEAILNNSPALVALPAPEEGEEADYEVLY